MLGLLGLDGYDGTVGVRSAYDRCGSGDDRKFWWFGEEEEGKREMSISKVCTRCAGCGSNVDFVLRTILLRITPFYGKQCNVATCSDRAWAM